MELPTTAQGFSAADDPLVRFLLSEVRKRGGGDVSGDRVANSRIADAAVRARSSLEAGTSTVHVRLPFLSATATGPFHFDSTLTKSNLERIDREASLPSEPNVP
jgi:molecular chaperone DnaK